MKKTIRICDNCGQPTTTAVKGISQASTNCDNDKFADKFAIKILVMKETYDGLFCRKHTQEADLCIKCFNELFCVNLTNLGKLVVETKQDYD